MLLHTGAAIDRVLATPVMVPFFVLFNMPKSPSAIHVLALQAVYVILVALLHAAKVETLLPETVFLARHATCGAQPQIIDFFLRSSSSLRLVSAAAVWAVIEQTFEGTDRLEMHV
jgi:hypothetical protein